MRGTERKQETFTVFYSIEEMVAKRLAPDHPLRIIKAAADEILRRMSPEIDVLYAAGGRPSIAAELILRALLWQALFLCSKRNATCCSVGFRHAGPLVCRTPLGLFSLGSQHILGKSRASPTPDPDGDFLLGAAGARAGLKLGHAPV